jgi:dTDP-4-dehydrorhamnose reductase
MKLLLLGNTGQLGWELERTLQPLGEVVALDFPQFNMADAASIRKTVREHRPQVIVNATAYTAVDIAESEPKLVDAINGSEPVRGLAVNITPEVSLGTIFCTTTAKAASVWGMALRMR